MKIYLLFTLLTCCIGLSQNRKEVTDNVIRLLDSKEPVEMLAEYRLYTAGNNSLPIERYTAVYCKAPGKFYYKIATVEMILSDKVYLKVDHKRKRIIVGKDTAGKEDKIIPFVDVVKAFEAGSFKDNNGYWNMEFLAGKKVEAEYQKVVFEIGKDFRIQKSKFYYRAPINISKDYQKPDYQKPVLEIIYGKNKAVSPYDSRFSIKRFIAGTYRKYKATAAFKNYELIYLN